MVQAVGPAGQACTRSSQSLHACQHHSKHILGIFWSAAQQLSHSQHQSLQVQCWGSASCMHHLHISSTSTPPAHTQHQQHSSHQLFCKPPLPPSSCFPASGSSHTSFWAGSLAHTSHTSGKFPGIAHSSRLSSHHSNIITHTGSGIAWGHQHWHRQAHVVTHWETLPQNPLRNPRNNQKNLLERTLDLFWGLFGPQRERLWTYGWGQGLKTFTKHFLNSQLGVHPHLPFIHLN